jgi:uncharacterized protein YraI
MFTILQSAQGRFALVLGASVAVLAMPGSGLAQEPAQTTSNVNLRGGPGTEHAVIAAMPQGAQVQILRCPTPGSWCELQYRGTVGWAAARFLTVDPAETGATEQPRRRITPLSSESTIGGY